MVRGVMANYLELAGLECEEAMALIRMSIRKSGLPLTVCSDSQSFKLLLQKWAQSNDRVLVHQQHGDDRVWALEIQG